MAHDVFISYSTKDKPVADAVCASLEGHGIRCWIAPRDIIPGMDWGGSIVEAIESARLMVLVLSASADASPQILREVERAVNKGVRIIPLRIEDVQPGKNLEYFLGTPHWLDAITPPLEEHLRYLAQTVKVLLEQQVSDHTEELPPPPPPTAPSPKAWRPSRNLLLLGAMAAAVLILVLATIWLIAGHRPVPSELVGTWTTSGISGPDTIQFTVEIAANGTYRYNVVYRESGQVLIDEGQMYLTTPGGAEKLVGPVTPSNAPVMTDNLADAAPSGVWTLIARFSGVDAQPPQSNPFKPTAAANGQSAVWEWNPAFGEVVWEIRFAFDQSGGYTFTAHASDLGSLTAADGKWSANSEILNRHSEGSYSFVSKDSMVMTGTLRGAVTTMPNGQTLWERSTATAAVPTTTQTPSESSAASQSPTPLPSATITTATPSPTPSLRALDRRFLVSHDSPVYAGPNGTTAVIGSVRRFSHVHVTGLIGNWLQIRLRGGAVGFIPDSAVE
jgi:hypothetical protein